MAICLLFIGADGTQRWYKEDKPHRDGDLPAVIDADGTQKWYKEGKLHRDGNLPALIDADGTQKWYKEDNLHRVIYADGTQSWYINGYCQANKSIECDTYPLNLPLGIQYYHQDATTKLEECPICYEEIQDCDFRWQCTSNHHPYFFHAKCLFKSNLIQKCPYCRSFISNSQECTKFVFHYGK